MPLTYSVAIDTIYGIFNQAWEAGASNIAGYVPEIRWPGVPNPTPEPIDKYWARPTFKTVTSKQTTLTNANTVRTRTVGLVIIQVYCPKGADQPLVAGRLLAELIRSAFKPPSGTDLWFRDRKIVELDPTDNDFLINVIVTCTFDTLES